MKIDFKDVLKNTVPMRVTESGRFGKISYIIYVCPILMLVIPGETSPILKKTGNYQRVIIRQVSATLSWKGLNYPQKLFDARHKEELIPLSPYFPAVWPSNVPTVADLHNLIVIFDAKILANEKGGEGAAMAVKNAANAVFRCLKRIMTVVQNVIDDDANAGKGEEICVSFGYTYDGTGVRGPRENGAYPTNEPGEIQVEAEGQGQHDWLMSDDGGVTSKALPGTSGGITFVQNLISKKEYLFRNRQVFSGGRYGKWSPWYPGTPL